MEILSGGERRAEQRANTESCRELQDWIWARERWDESTYSRPCCGMRCGIDKDSKNSHADGTNGDNERWTRDHHCIVWHDWRLDGKQQDWMGHQNER